MNLCCPQCRYPLSIGGLRCPECGIDVQWQAESPAILKHARLLGTVYLFIAVMLVFATVMHLDAERYRARAMSLGHLIGEANNAAMQFHIAWNFERQGGPPTQLPDMRAEPKWDSLDSILRGWPGASRGASTSEILRSNVGDLVAMGLSAATCLLLSVVCFRSHRRPSPPLRARWLHATAIVLMGIIALAFGAHAALLTLQ